MEIEINILKISKFINNKQEKFFFQKSQNMKKTIQVKDNIELSENKKD